MKASRFYFQVPENLPAFPAEEQIAWIAVLASRFKGAPMGHRELRQLTGWGGSRADRLLAEVVEWEQGKAGAEPGQSRGKAGAAPGQSRGSAGAADTGEMPGTKKERGSTGAAPGQSRGKAGAEPGQSRGKAGAVPADSAGSPATLPASKIDRSEIDRSDSLSPTSLSPATERESVPAREGAGQPTGGPSAPAPAPDAPGAGSGRGGAVVAPADGLAGLLPARLVAALQAGGVGTVEQARTRTDRELRYLPGVGEAGLATIRQAIPAGTATATATKTEAELRRERALELIQKAGKKNRQPGQPGGTHA